MELIKGLEFYTDYMTGSPMYRRIGEQVVRELMEKDVDIISSLLELSKKFYPEQYEALCKEYEKSSLNNRYYNFLMARRIVSCCYGDIDNKVDINVNGELNFEHIKCPRMAECKYHGIICQPKFSTTLTERENEVMKLYVQGESTEGIAERLFISIHTVMNHKKSALRRLNLHSIEEFINYAFKKKMYDDI